MLIQRSKVATKDFLYNPCLGCKKSRNNRQTNSSNSNTSHKIIHEFAKSFKQNFQFTNHESLPSFTEFLSYLKKAYPPQMVTSLADQIRADEYYHLSISNRVYLDYIGHGLFSYSQVHKCHPNAAIASTSSSPPPPQFSEIPFFEIALNSTNLVSQLQNQEGQESEFESSMRKRIMKYMNMSGKDYSMVFTVNQVSAFRILSDSYPFDSTEKLLTMYDHKCEATEAMIQSSKKKGAHVISAEFLWPCLKINSKKLKKKMVSQKKKKRKGLFVFPLQSRVTGARYPYYWMNIAHENGWHSFLDADALGAKAMDTLGLSLFQPDFITCSFYKIFGDNPSGFSCLFVKKSSISVLDSSSISIGIINLLPSKESTFSKVKIDQEILEETGETQDAQHIVKSKNIINDSFDLEIDCTNESSLIDLLNSERKIEKKQKRINKANYTTIECRGLDHADTIGLILIRDRAKYQVNWLVNALLSLHYPNSDNLAAPLIRIYGPKLRLDRGTSVAFNIFDWKKEKIDPALVQKLADRYNISVSCGILQNVCFSDKDIEYEQMLEMEGGTRKRKDKEFKKKGKFDDEITVVTVSIDFLNNFEDLYRLWVFVARFLDADFVEKEKWKYMALNQTTVEI